MATEDDSRFQRERKPDKTSVTVTDSKRKKLMPREPAGSHDSTHSKKTSLFFSSINQVHLFWGLADNLHQRWRREKKKKNNSAQRVCRKYSAPRSITANSPLFGCRRLVSEEFAEPPPGRPGAPGFRPVGAGRSSRRRLPGLLFGRGVGLLHEGGQVRLGRGGTRPRLRLRLGNRRRRLGEETEEGALLRHERDFQGALLFRRVFLR